MCLREDCQGVDTLEIYTNIKIVTHYNKDNKPIFIQYWDETKPIYEQTCFELKKSPYSCKTLARGHDD